ncbi:MAG: PIN domain-containing protein [Oscillospiraceae bacterium]|nr:PIN domain-containing protein [Oscillospiraceae bacterium]
MRIADANVLLRYILDDHEELSSKARRIIDRNVIYVPVEVLCEVVFVLLKVYKAERNDIGRQLCSFFVKTNCILPNREAVLKGLELFAENNLDFVDCILVGYMSVEGAEIDTFDSKLLRVLKSFE